MPNTRGMPSAEYSVRSNAMPYLWPSPKLRKLYGCQHAECSHGNDH